MMKFLASMKLASAGQIEQLGSSHEKWLSDKQQLSQRNELGLRPIAAGMLVSLPQVVHTRILSCPSSSNLSDFGLLLSELLSNPVSNTGLLFSGPTSSTAFPTSGPLRVLFKYSSLHTQYNNL